MKMSQNGRQVLTMPSEGLRLRAYDDLQPNKLITSQSQVQGTLTIGYGHTGKDVYPGLECNQERAVAWLITDLASAEATVLKYRKVAVTQNMNDALIDFVFNAGSGNFQKSTLLKKLNASDYLGCADEFLRWNKSKGVVLNGLTVRCEARRDLFLQGIGVNTYYAPDGKAMSVSSSENGLIKLVAFVSGVSSII